MEALLRVIAQLQATNRELQTTVQRQQQRIELLEAEIRRLKELPDPPKRPPQPSPLNDASGPPSVSGKKNPTTPDGKRPGSAKRSKTRHLVIHDDVPLPLDGLPDGTKLLGYQDFTVQDLRVESHNTCYRRCHYQLPNGTIVTAPLPKDVTSHFGPTLRQYVLYQHFHNHVTQPLLHEELLELGVDISAGQVNRLLTEGHETFHEEKDSLLPAAREVSTYLQTDDTSARHRGKGGHTLHIGNDLFASFFTTDTKSRVNFLKILLAPHARYRFNGDALFYLECFEVPQKLLTQLQPDADAGRVYEDDASWEKQLDAWNLTSADQRRLVTEGALWADLLAQGLYSDLVLISDDAAQFKLLAFLHALCWVHMERHVARLIPLNDDQRAAHEEARDAIWSYYQRLKAYRQAPTPQRRGRLESDFDRLFLKKTGWSELDDELQKIHGKKSELLLVLEHPEIPLHNNLSENDIRQYVKKRKISAGTRSDAGRRCRDTFLSLKTTCRKLGVTFWQYLRDRIRRLNDIPPLAELIRRKATEPAKA
ncbi:MAG: transposase [Rhodobacteraceae bacterium]|nr:transposase [Paracoccaceae bacterium]